MKLKKLKYKLQAKLKYKAVYLEQLLKNAFNEIWSLSWKTFTIYPVS